MFALKAEIKLWKEEPVMTREEIRRAFRQAHQEEFAAVPERPTIHASPQFQQKIGRLLGTAPRHMSKTKRIAVLLLAAVVLLLGGCTVYQIVNASIQYNGTYDYINLESEHRYSVADAAVSEDAGHIPHYQFPSPEGFLLLCSNDAGQDYLYPVACVDQWYNPDTGDVLTLIQQRQYNGLELDCPVQLKSTQLGDITVYYGCGEQEAYAFWLYGQSAMKLNYWGAVSEEQLLSWIQQMDYTEKPAETSTDTAWEYYCCIPGNAMNSDRPPEEMEFRYYLNQEVYQQMEEEDTGRDARADYNFSTAPEGFTLTQAQNEYSPDEYSPDEKPASARTACAAYTYENAGGDRLVLSQTILMPLSGSGHWILPVSGSRLGEEVQVLDMDGIYIREEASSRLIWRYGGRQMEFTYSGEISKEDFIALAETVDYTEE